MDYCALPSIERLGIVLFLSARDSEECWPFYLKTRKKGYGVFCVGYGRRVGAHRLSYEYFVGPISDGLVIDHLCRNKECVNPKHLEAVATGVNTQRGNSGINQRIKTHCPQGHPYCGDNLIIRADGFRRCRTCQRSYGRKKR